jgi:hypothetical protein
MVRCKACYRLSGSSDKCQFCGEILDGGGKRADLPAKECAACKTPMVVLGEIPLRIGGTTGPWVFLLGGIAELKEGVWPIAAYRCASCRRLELFDFNGGDPPAR